MHTAEAVVLGTSAGDAGGRAAFARCEVACACGITPPVPDRQMEAVPNVWAEEWPLQDLQRVPADEEIVRCSVLRS